MIAIRQPVDGAGTSARCAAASVGERVMQAFECFPVMTVGELALIARIADHEAAAYLLALARMGLAETDGENYWVSAAVDADARRQ